MYASRNACSLNQTTVELAAIAVSRSAYSRNRTSFKSAAMHASRSGCARHRMSSTSTAMQCFSKRMLQNGTSFSWSPPPTDFVYKFRKDALCQESLVSSSAPSPQRGVMKMSKAIKVHFISQAATRRSPTTCTPRPLVQSPRQYRPTCCSLAATGCMERLVLLMLAATAKIWWTQEVSRERSDLSDGKSSLCSIGCQ